MSFLPNKIILDNYVRYILNEDITYSDITTDLIVEENKNIAATINFRQEGIVCGLPFAQELYKLLNPDLKWTILKQEGERVSKNTNVATIYGSAKAILTGERSALNLIQKASGIATLTAEYAAKILKTKTRLTDTRKNTPGARILEKYSIRVGGAFPHRYNLSDCVMIKDNHIAIAGSISEAVARVKKYNSHTTKIEVEAENESQVKEALNSQVDIIMLDNMSPQLLKEMVEIINSKVITEASGNINLENIYDIALTGVDYISTSAIVTKAPTLDVGMDIKH